MGFFKPVCEIRVIEAFHLGHLYGGLKAEGQAGYRLARFIVQLLGDTLAFVLLGGQGMLEKCFISFAYSGQPFRD